MDRTGAVPLFSGSAVFAAVSEAVEDTVVSAEAASVTGGGVVSVLVEVSADVEEADVSVLTDTEVTGADVSVSDGISVTEGVVGAAVSGASVSEKEAAASVSDSVLASEAVAEAGVVSSVSGI